MIAPTPKIAACGTITVGSWPNDRISDDTALQVKFGEAFEAVPNVIVQLAAIDAHSPAHKRIETWASDVSCEGFRLHVRTWDDSVTWMVKVSWIAAADPAQVQLGLCSASDITGAISDRPSSPETIRLPQPFLSTPTVGIALSGLDASGDDNLCLSLDTCDVCNRGFALDCTSWRPRATTWNATMAWIASSSPAALQMGAESFGSCSSLPTEEPIRSGADRCVDVAFPMAFDVAPSVALALVGVEADHKTPVRVDTWTDNITPKGFRLHVRSWADSTTLFAKVAWVAVPVTLDVSVERLAPHSPPSAYAAVGEPLGQGVMGVTHKARHVLDGQIYAVKTCKHPFKHHEDALRKELANLARLPQHCNLLRYFTSVLEADRLHIVTECLEAFKFAELLPSPDGLFPSKHHPNAVLKWTSQLFDGLAHMHAVGMLHRDLHSENVMVLKDPQDANRPSQGQNAVRIIDFGVAKVVGEACSPSLMSNPAGFWQYVSPERRRGSEFDDRDDVWAAGCHLLELSSGKAIRRRDDCGPDGEDFAVSPNEIRKAIQECGNARCRETLDYVLVAERQQRPSAASAHLYACAALQPPTPVPHSPRLLLTAERSVARKRKRPVSAGGRRTRFAGCREMIIFD